MQVLARIQAGEGANSRFLWSPSVFLSHKETSLIRWGPSYSSMAISERSISSMTLFPEKFTFRGAVVTVLT